MNPSIFRKYDIRGVVDRDLPPPVVRNLGRAIGTHARRQGRRRLAVGRDIQLSSDSLFASLAGGLMEAGCDAVDIGMVPTPVLYFATHRLGVDGGVRWKRKGDNVEITVPRLNPSKMPCRFAWTFKIER